MAKREEGAKELGNFRSLIQMVSMWSASQHLVLGQTKVSEKSNEITTMDMDGISVAETLQKLAPNAKVVEAFNSTFAETIAADSRQFGDGYPSVFYCGDDDEAKKVVAGLIQDCDYEAVDVGKLQVARSLETLATAWVQFAAASQLFPNLGLKALRR